MDISRREFVLSGACAGMSAWLPRSQLTELERLIPALMRQAAVPGVAFALVKDAGVVWHREFGVRDTGSGESVDRHTVFEAASVSKTVFAYAVMQLCDRGVLALDTPLTQYLPDRILEGDPRLDLITARHVLSHTSGLPNTRSGAEPLRIHFTPGERFLYSGEGYWYLQSVITHLAGRVDLARCGDYEAGMRQCATDIDTYLRTNVLTPCGMKASGYIWNDDLARHTARPHDGTGRPLPQGKPTPVDAGRYAAMGGLRTTALDYAAFLTELLQPRSALPFRLTAPTRREMLRSQVPVEGPKSWALGWEINETPRGRLIQHQGGQAGVQAFTAASPDRRSGYVILTNGDNGWKVFYDERFVALVNQILLP